ncbi:MAG: amidophosphoribosyltransferase, partial [Sphingomonadales bacterium]|nr:amidophosphoribosyltransferase [Sphingomonadales bacterium]
HNGNITNAMHIREKLVNRGSIFQSNSDTEVIVHLIATSEYRTFMDRFIDAVKQIEGAFSLVALTPGGIIGARDPHGVRPLVLGRLDDEVYIFASETCALDIIGAKYVRDVEPGEIVNITERGVESLHPFPKTHPRPCVFEHVYFSRPDSFIDNMNVYEVRKRIGIELARENPVDADIIVPVPDSGTPAAIGYSQESDIPFELGIIRNHYVGRTFIEPTDHIRHLGVKLKHNANRWQIEGKKVVLVDDSIVRGTTSMKIVNMMREAGATEVHMCIASPPTMHSCFYGVDTPERQKLLAAQMDVEAMRKHIEADSLAFISIDGLYRACEIKKGRDDKCPAFCDACFTGDYPTFL